MTTLDSKVLQTLAGLLMTLSLAACGGSGALADALGPLPQATDARPLPGCTIVSVAEAEALPREYAASDSPGPRRALLRHVADCLPKAPGATEAYRIQFVQDFTERQGKPGPGARWNGGEARLDDTLEVALRSVDAGSEGVGKNCRVHLARIERETIPCVRAMDAGTGDQLAQALTDFRRQNGFPMNVHNDNHLQMVEMGRDERCLQVWDQIKGQLETRFLACFGE